MKVSPSETFSMTASARSSLPPSSATARPASLGIRSGRRESPMTRAPRCRARTASIVASAPEAPVTRRHEPALTPPVRSWVRAIGPVAAIAAAVVSGRSSGIGDSEAAGVLTSSA